MLTRLWWGAMLVALLGLLVLVWPYAASAYHLEIGGRALETALAPVFPDRLTPEQIVDAERLQVGAAHLKQALRWDSRNVQARRLLARAYLSQGEPEAALETLQEALAVQPANPLLHLELGDVYHALGQTEAAIQAYETGGVGSRGVLAAAYYVELAEAQAQQGNGDIAVDLWQRALEADPGNLYALYRLAEMHRALGDEEQAIVYEERLRYFDLQSVALSDPRMAEYQGRVMATLVDDGIWARETLLNVVSYQVWQFPTGVSGTTAEQVLDTLLEWWPEDPDLLFYLAELYHRRQDLDQAEAAYQRVLAVAPGYAQAYLRLGMVGGAKCQMPNAKCQNELGEAARWYKQYQEMAPDDLLGLKRLAEVCATLEEAGVEDESCREAAQRVMGKEDANFQPAVVLRQSLTAYTDDRRIVAELLDVPVETVELGPNLVENGGFEEWVDGRPKWWRWSDMFNREPLNAAAFVGGDDELLPFEGKRAARVDGFWVQQQEGKSPARAGFWQPNEKRQTRRSVKLMTNVPYVFSLHYHTTRVLEGKATVWVSGDPGVFWAGDHGLPATSGTWYHFVAVGWNRSDAEATIRPLVRSFAPGRLEFDDVQVRPIWLPEGTTVDIGETRFWIIGKGN